MTIAFFLSRLLALNFFFVLVLSTSVRGQGEDLSEADRVSLISELERIQKQSDDRVSGLYQRAVKDFRSAIRSDEATMDLYLKCFEKVRYIDLHRKSQDFRDWKRNERNKEMIQSSSMKMALRLQLSWLLLSIEAARMDGDTSELGKRAVDHLDKIFANAKTLKAHRNILNQNVLSSVFAKAYNLNIKVKNWPTSAFDITQVYEKVVMPPLRESKDIASLRSAWRHRIAQEQAVFEKWNDQDGENAEGKSGKKKRVIGMKKNMRTHGYEVFLDETRPQLLWSMEVDCFKAGDEKASALRMLKHLQTYITHKNAPQWIKEFQDLIQPQEDLEEDAVAEER
jgi:hypothetical protein